MDIPYAIQKYLQADAGVQAAVRQGVSWPTCAAGGISLLELDQNIDRIMPVECVVIRAAGGPGGLLTIQLNDQRIAISSYGSTPHLAYSLDQAVYRALKNLAPSVWAKTYLHWAHPTVRSNAMIEPTSQWPVTISVWQVRASDLTIAA